MVNLFVKLDASPEATPAPSIAPAYIPAGPPAAPRIPPPMLPATAAPVAKRLLTILSDSYNSARRFAFPFEYAVRDGSPLPDVWYVFPGIPITESGTAEVLFGVQVIPAVGGATSGTRRDSPVLPKPLAPAESILN